MLPTTRPLITSCNRYCIVIRVVSLQISDGERRPDPRRLAVLVLDRRVDRDGIFAGVYPLDHMLVPFPHERPADLARAGQLVVVRVELLVERDEFFHPVSYTHLTLPTIYSV